MSLKITPERVMKFWKYMERRYSFKTVKRSDDLEMKLIFSALSSMGCSDFGNFLENASMTIPLGTYKMIYIPFTVGQGNLAELCKQIRTCVHECQHIIQSSNDISFLWKYLSSSTNRAHYEADAYRTDIEMHKFLTGRILSPKKLSSHLEHYAIDQADIKIFERHLTIAAKYASKGLVSMGATKKAIKWWQKQGV